MTRFLDWLDESAAGMIRVAYLLAGVIAVANYFADGNVPHWLAALLNAILPWALAGALEIHTYLTARRVRKSWQDWSAAALDSDEHERAGGQMKLNLWILGALLAFSMYNQLQYLAQTWTPPHTPLTPPGFWPYLIRATVTPAAFMAAAFLAPVGEGLALQVQSQAHALAVATFKVATQQWKRRLRQMQQTGQDVTGALVQLVDDPAERRVIDAIWHAMQHPSRIEAPSAPASDASVEAVPGAVTEATPAAKRQEEPAPAAPVAPVAPVEAPATPTTPAPTAPTTPRQPAPLPFPAQRPQQPQPQPQRREEREQKPALAPAARRSPGRGLGRNALNMTAAPADRADRADRGNPDDDKEPAPAGGAREPAERVTDRGELRRRREEAARRILADDPGITNTALARRIAMATQAKCSEYTARSIRAMLTGAGAGVDAASESEEDEDARLN